MASRLVNEVAPIHGIPVPVLLRQFRRSLQLDQKQIAEKYRIPSGTYKRWESTSKKRGAPNLSDHFELLRDFFSWLKTDRME